MRQKKNSKTVTHPHALLRSAFPLSRERGADSLNKGGGVSQANDKTANDKNDQQYQIH